MSNSLVTTVPLQLAVLISGSGTTLRNLLECIADGRLSAQVAMVISSNPTAGGLQYARDNKIPYFVEPRRRGQTSGEYSELIFTRCRTARVDLVVMGGFLKHVLVPADFEDRVVNIHPSLVPAFCGQGYYGRHVHEAVLDYGAKVSGCTVHFVDNQFDHGPIILQRVVEVAEDDTPESLAQRVFQQECAAYPQAIQWLAEHRVERVGRRVHIARQVQ